MPDARQPLTAIERTRYDRPPVGTPPRPAYGTKVNGSEYMVMQLRLVDGVLTEVYDSLRMSTLPQEDTI